MKNVLTAFMFIILMAGCNENGRKLKKMEDNYRIYINDMGFKLNADVNIYDLKAIDFQVVGDSLLILNKIIVLDEIYKREMTKMELQMAKVKHQMALYKLTQTKPNEFEISDLEEMLAKVDESNNALTQLSAIEDSLRKSIQTANEAIFNTKIFLKKEFVYQNGEKSKSLDTLQVLFDKQLRPIDLFGWAEQVKAGLATED